MPGEGVDDPGGPRPIDELMLPPVDADPQPARRRAGLAAALVVVVGAGLGFWWATGDQDETEQLALQGGYEPRVLVATTRGEVLVVAADTGEVRQRLVEPDPVEPDAAAPHDGVDQPGVAPGAVLAVSVDAADGTVWWIVDGDDGPVLWRLPLGPRFSNPGSPEPVVADAWSVAAAPGGAVVVLSSDDCAEDRCLHRVVDAGLSSPGIGVPAARVPRLLGDDARAVVLAPATCRASDDENRPTTTLEHPASPPTLAPQDEIHAPTSPTLLDSSTTTTPALEARGACPIEQVALFDPADADIDRPQLPATTEDSQPWELWALSGSTGWAVSAPSACDDPATVARLDLTTGTIEAQTTMTDHLGRLRPADALGDGRVVLTAGHGHEVGCRDAPSVLALWDPASGEVSVVLDDVAAAAAWPPGLDDVPPTTVPPTSPTTAPATTVPATADPPPTGPPGDADPGPAWERCSAEDLEVPPSQSGLPAAIQDTRTEVLEAAVGCDTTRLAVLLGRGAASGSSIPMPDDFAPLSAQSPQATVAWWQEREAAGEPVLAALVVTLASGYFCDLDGSYDEPRCVWFSSSDDDPLPGHLHLASITPDGFSGWSEGLLQVSFVGALLEDWHGDHRNGAPPPEGTVFVGPPRSERPALPPGWPTRAITESYVARLAAIDPITHADLADPSVACPSPTSAPSPLDQWECVRGR